MSVKSLRINYVEVLSVIFCDKGFKGFKMLKTIDRLSMLI